MGPKNQTPPKPGQPYFDYGCQYLTPSSEILKTEISRWQGLGLVQPLSDGQAGVFHATDQRYQPLKRPSFVANGGFGPLMESLTKLTAKEFPNDLTHVSGFPNMDRRVVGLRKDTESKKWFLQTKKGDWLGPFDIVIGAFGQHVLTDPFLLSGGAPCQSILDCVRRIESNQIIAVQMTLGKPVPKNDDFVVSHVQDDPVLSFLSNNSRKPQQNGTWGTPGPEHWTLLSTAEFAEREFNQNPKGYRKIAEEKMLAAFARTALKIDTLDEFRNKYNPKINRINHWEDGLPTNTPPNSQGCLFDAKENLGWCGDFCVSPSVDGAACSGVSVANKCLEYIQTGKISNEQNLLPSDLEWVPISQNSAQVNGITVDIGQFGHCEKDGLAPMITHTNLVPSAIGGYQKQKAHFGAGGGPKGSGNGRKNNGSGSGRGNKNNRSRRQNKSTGDRARLT